MQSYSFEDTIKYMIGQSTANQPNYGKIHAINGHTVDITVRGSSVVIRNVQVLGDIKTYAIGQVVNIQWQGNAPVVSGVTAASAMSSGIPRGYGAGGGSVVPDNVTIDYGPAGLEIKAGGIQLDRLAFTPSLAGHTHQDSLQKAGWQVDEGGVISKDDVNINPHGQISLGLAPDIIKLDAAHAVYRIWVGDVDPAVANFAVEKNGSVHIRDGVFTLGDAIGYLSGVGYFLGEDGGVYKTHIGDPAGNHMSWDGTNVNISAAGGAVSIDEHGITIQATSFAIGDQGSYKLNDGSWTMAYWDGTHTSGGMSQNLVALKVNPQPSSMYQSVLSLIAEGPSHGYGGTVNIIAETLSSSPAMISLHSEDGFAGITVTGGMEVDGDINLGVGHQFKINGVPFVGGGGGGDVYLGNSNIFGLINPLITPAESWIGPSATTGIYFKDGGVGIGGVPSWSFSITTPDDNRLTFGSDGGLFVVANVTSTEELSSLYIGASGLTIEAEYINLFGRVQVDGDINLTAGHQFYIDDVPFVGGGGVSDAADLTYTPAYAVQWDGGVGPGNANAAFDQLALRIGNVEATYISGHHIASEGVSQPTEQVLDFVGSGVTVTDVPDSVITRITISGGISEAPVDGSPYSRQDAGWISASHFIGNITVDGSIFLGAGGVTQISSQNSSMSLAKITMTAQNDAGNYAGVSVIAAADATSEVSIGADDVNLYGAVKIWDSAQIVTDLTVYGKIKGLISDGNVELPGSDGQYSGITFPGTAGATLAFGDLCQRAAADSRWELADANVITAATADVRGVLGLCVLAASGDGQPTRMLLFGTINAATAFPTFTVNGQIFVSETAGDVTQTIPATLDAAIRCVGYALTTDIMFFNPSPDYITRIA